MSFKVGDVVKVRAEFTRSLAHQTSTYTVVKVNPRTLGLRSTQNGASMKADPDCLMYADEVKNQSAVVTMLDAPEAVETFYAGQVVTGTRMKGVKPTDLLVVTGEVARGYRVARLGGDVGRYYTGVPAKNLTLVNMDELAAALVAAN